VLDISQIEAGTFNIRPERFELITVLNTIITEFRPEVALKGLTITQISRLRSTIIESDRYCVTEAISNLLNNAIKYTEKGGITVSITRKNNQLNLKIIDTGIGMSNEYMQNMFEAFSQESTGYTKKFQGVGLGLALTKRYIDYNNIKIDLTSQQGVGTTVSLTFPPLAKAATKISISSYKSPKIKDAIRVPAKTCKILLVEDDPGSRKLVELILGNNFSHLWAETVDRAKKQLEKESIDIVLLDLSLYGDEDGLDLVRWMRKTKRWKDCPVIALTAHAFTTDRDLCLKTGCNDYITKPIDKVLLLEKINKLIKD
jgi:CheY-like chemotaxis protein/anti-sigma regulatory factor (Ser/Thr protein kinase)